MSTSKEWPPGGDHVSSIGQARWMLRVRDAASGTELYSCRVPVKELVQILGRTLFDGRVQHLVADCLEHEIEARLAVAGPARVAHGPLLVELAARRVFVNGAVVELTRREFDLLAFFVQNPDRAVSRRELVARLWDDAEELSSQRTVDIHVRRLRAKLTRRAFPLVTVVGVGYRFTPATAPDDGNAEAAGTCCA